MLHYKIKQIFNKNKYLNLIAQLKNFTLFKSNLKYHIHQILELTRYIVIMRS